MFTFKTRMILRAIGAVFGMAAVLTTVSGCGSVPETVVTTPAAVTDLGTDTVPDATPGTADPTPTAATPAPVITPKATTVVRHTGTMTHTAKPATTTAADTTPVTATVIDAPPTGLVNPGATTPDDPTAARVGPIL